MNDVEAVQTQYLSTPTNKILVGRHIKPEQLSMRLP